jgi:hypothetical protein
MIKCCFKSRRPIQNYRLVVDHLDPQDTRRNYRNQLVLGFQE